MTNDEPTNNSHPIPKKYNRIQTTLQQDRMGYVIT